MFLIDGTVEVSLICQTGSEMYNFKRYFDEHFRFHGPGTCISREGGKVFRV